MRSKTYEPNIKDNWNAFEIRRTISHNDSAFRYLRRFSAVINLKSYLCVYEVAKLLIQSAGDFGAIDLTAMKELGFRAVYYVCMGFGMHGMSLLCSHISAYHTVARIRIRLIQRLGTLPIGYHTLHPSGKQRKIIEKNTDNLEILMRLLCCWTRLRLLQTQKTNT